MIAFRGTEADKYDWKDFWNDYQNAYLKEIPAQYQDALKFTETIIEKIDKAHLGYKIILTGHSLGGGLASYAAIRLSRPSVSAVIFNAAGLGEGITSAIKLLSDTQIAQIKSQMNEGLSAETQYLSDMLSTLISDAKLGINIPSITNIHLVGDPLPLCPGQQAGVFTLLTVPPHFIWYDDSGKQIQKFSTLASHIPLDLAYTGSAYRLIPDGWFAPLVGDANYAKMLISDYTKLLVDHKGLDVRSLPVEPHYMTNVINALKAKAANN